MRTAVYPGTFDPVTYGHIDVIERAAKMFDRVIVAVLINLKKTPMFSIEERVEFIKDGVKHLPNVEVDYFNGLIVNYLESQNAWVIIRGLRFISDLETELQMASMNKNLMPQCDTIFIPTSIEYSYLSSSIVKEIARHGGDVGHFVPDTVHQALVKQE